MRCLYFLLAAVLFTGSGISAFAASKKPHHRARAHAVAAPRHAHGKRAARLRRAALEAKDDSPSATIPDVPLKHAKLILLPPLKGSRASLVRQNERSEADGLARIEDDDQLKELRARPS